MKTLVIYAHPDTGGHCATIFKAVKDYLSGHNIEFEALDLYRMKYDPVLHEDEHYTRGNRNISNQNQEIQSKLLEYERYIFIYPVWWGTMPAILKGFFDRVLTSGFAFRYVNGSPVGLLKGKKAFVFMTSGTNIVFSRIFQGTRPRHNVRDDILRFCGIKVKLKQFGGSLRFDETKEPKLIEAVVKNLNSFYR